MVPIRKGAGTILFRCAWRFFSVLEETPKAGLSRQEKNELGFRDGQRFLSSLSSWGALTAACRLFWYAILDPFETKKPASTVLVQSTRVWRLIEGRVPLVYHLIDVAVAREEVGAAFIGGDDCVRAARQAGGREDRRSGAIECNAAERGIGAGVDKTHHTRRRARPGRGSRHHCREFYRVPRVSGVLRRSYAVAVAAWFTI